MTEFQPKRQQIILYSGNFESGTDYEFELNRIQTEYKMYDLK